MNIQLSQAMLSMNVMMDLKMLVFSGTSGGVSIPRVVTL